MAKPDERLIMTYGRMNRVSPPMVGVRLDENSSNTMERLSQMAKESHAADVFAGGGPYRAQVLRIDSARAKDGAGLDKDTAEHDIYVGEDRDKSTSLLRVKARIPELHAGLPIPKGLGDGDGEFQKIIDMYPTFTAESDGISEGDIAVGDVVWVNFVDKINYRDGILVTGVKGSAGGASGKGSSASNAREGACAGTHGAQGASKPTGDSLPASNKAKAHSGVPLRQRRSANVMSGEFVFMEDGTLSKKTAKLWEKGARAKAPPGRSLWSQIGLYRTLIYCPNVTDTTQRKEFIWIFPPEEQSYNSEFFNSIVKVCYDLSMSLRNYVLILSLPHSRFTNIRKVARAGEEVRELGSVWQNTRDQFSLPPLVQHMPDMADRVSDFRADIARENAARRLAAVLDVEIEDLVHRPQGRHVHDDAPNSVRVPDGIGIHVGYETRIVPGSDPPRMVPTAVEHYHGLGRLEIAYDDTGDDFILPIMIWVEDQLQPAGYYEWLQMHHEAISSGVEYPPPPAYESGILGALPENWLAWEGEEEMFPVIPHIPADADGDGVPNEDESVINVNPFGQQVFADPHAALRHDALRRNLSLLRDRFDRVLLNTLAGALRLRLAQRSLRTEWVQGVEEKLRSTFGIGQRSGDTDSYFGIDSGLRSIMSMPFQATAHCRPKTVTIIKPTVDLDNVFLAELIGLSNHYTIEHPSLPDAAYTQFDFNIILEADSQASFDKVLIQTVGRTTFNRFLYVAENAPEKLGKDPVTEGLDPLSLRFATVINQPQVSPYDFITFITDRHSLVMDGFNFGGAAIPEPGQTQEEAEEQLAEQVAEVTEMLEDAEQPPKAPAPAAPPPTPEPSPPSQRPRRSVTPRAAARVSEALRFKENRVKVAHYGRLDRKKHANLLLDAPNTKGPGRVKLHVLAHARFMALRDAAAAAGFPDVKLRSGWRRHRWKSFELYKRSLKERGYTLKEGRKIYAYDSPHETGLAMDFGNHGLEPKSATKRRQQRTLFYKWLKDNAHKFGITPYKYEPWHWEVRLPYNAWASGQEFTDSYAVRVDNVGSKDVQIGDASAPIEGSKGSPSSASSPKPCVAKVGGSGAPGGSRGGVSTQGGGSGGAGSIPGEKPVPGKKSTVIAHPQDKFTIIDGSPCNGCHRRKNKLQELFVFHETGGHSNPVEKTQRTRWRKHRESNGKVNKEVHLWQGINGKFIQTCPLETNLPHANTVNKFSFGCEIASFSIDAAHYGGPAPKVRAGLHVIGNPDHSKGRGADIINPNSGGYRYPAILVPQEIQFEKIWQFVKWITTEDVPSSAGTKIDVPMNFPGIGKDGRFYFSAMGFGEPVPTVKNGAAYKWSRKGLRGLMAHARIHHADGLPFEYYCIQRSKGVPRNKAYYATIGALCSMDKKKAVPLLAPDKFAQLGTELFPFVLNHATRYTLGKKKWNEKLETYKKSYRLNIA